jgi:hypothetical protein
MPERHCRCVDPPLRRSASLSRLGCAALEDLEGPAPPLSVAPGSHRWEPCGGGGRTRGWLETAGTGEAPRRREEAGPQWLPDSFERQLVAWGRGTAREGEAGSSGGAWPSDSVVATFGKE